MSTLLIGRFIFHAMKARLFMSAPASALYATSIHSLPLLAKGKVRDTYIIDDKHLLMITTDRLSAFDVVMGEPIPDKGRVLNQMSNFWFEQLDGIVPNHLTGIDPTTVVAADEVEQVRGRSVVVKRLKPILVEAVVRGYIIGTGWKDYLATGEVCGIRLPENMQLAEKLPELLFTPAAKADVGMHDENISFEEVKQRIGVELAEQMRDISFKLYQRAADYAAERGIIIADTKFEFGLDDDGVLHVMDEVLTADSSRYWPADEYQVGISPPSFDKQYVRDYLESLDWAKTPPAPALPQEVVEATAAKYREALQRITGQTLQEQS